MTQQSLQWEYIQIKSEYQTYIYTLKFIAALLTTTKKWKESKHLSTEEQMKKIQNKRHKEILFSHKKMKYCHQKQHGWNGDDYDK